MNIIIQETSADPLKPGGSITKILQGPRPRASSIKRDPQEEEGLLSKPEKANEP